jgi:hypothetical protein
LGRAERNPTPYKSDYKIFIKASYFQAIAVILPNISSVLLDLHQNNFKPNRNNLLKQSNFFLEFAEARLLDYQQ